MGDDRVTHTGFFTLDARLVKFRKQSKMLGAAMYPQQRLYRAHMVRHLQRMTMNLNMIMYLAK